jgi:hypothetical protein
MLAKTEGRIVDYNHLTIADLHNVRVDLNTMTLFGSYMGLRLHFHQVFDGKAVTEDEVIDPWRTKNGRGEFYRLPAFCIHGKKCVIRPKDPDDISPIEKPTNKKIAAKVPLRSRIRMGGPDDIFGRRRF